MSTSENPKNPDDPSHPKYLSGRKRKPGRPRKPRIRKPRKPGPRSIKMDDPNVFVVCKPVPVRKLAIDYMTWILVKCNGDREKAADILGLSYKTIYNYIVSGRIPDVPDTTSIGK